MTTINLTADAEAVGLKTISSLQLALATIAERLKAGTLDSALATTCLQLAEFNLSEIGQILCIQTDSAADRAKRFVEVRAANEKVRELSELLGGKQSPEVTKLSIQALDARLNDWWDFEGFGHISEISFGRYGCKVVFSAALNGPRPLVGSSTPVSDVAAELAWQTELVTRGFMLTDVPGARDLALLDCDHNRDLMAQLIVGKMPSASLQKIENVYRGRIGQRVMHSLQVYVANLSEIDALPTAAGM